MKKKVLIMAWFYVPAVKGGGPIRSINNLINNLSDKIDFYVLTNDRDLGDNNSFKNIQVETWIEVGKAQVFYINKNRLTWKKIMNITKSIDFDFIYLNSFFSYKFSILTVLLWNIRKIPKKQIILAPRGEFSIGALSLKRTKKKFFIMVSKILGTYKNILWHATNEFEKNDIEHIFGNNTNILVANNLTPKYSSKYNQKDIIKKSRELKLVYIARIHPMKNLLQVLVILKELNNKIEFNIYGPIEDQEYWQKCENYISEMNNNIKVIYHGQINNDYVNEVYLRNHVAILLTLGENFGHSISEALFGGCPVIISDRTPWRNLEDYDVGKDISLDKPELIKETLIRFIDMDNDEYQRMSKNASLYAKNKSNSHQDILSYFNIFKIDLDN